MNDRANDNREQDDRRDEWFDVTREWFSEDE